MSHKNQQGLKQFSLEHQEMFNHRAKGKARQEIQRADEQHSA